MNQRDTHALLISGDEPRFFGDVLKFQRFLLEELNFDPNQVRIIFCTTGRQLMEQTGSFFENLRDEQPHNVVMLYAGHGGPEGFFQNRFQLAYEEWGRLITHDGDFVFINDSCYSGSSIDAFVRLGLLPQKELVIASSRADEKSYGGIFLEDLIQSYRNNQPFKRTELGPKINGKIVLIPPPEERRTINQLIYDFVMRLRGIEVIRVNSLEYEERYVQFEKPKMDVIQHPQRYGKDLDYILFKH